jgi:hypothetical protein
MRKETYPLRHDSAIGDAEPSDAMYGDWTKEKLRRMDAKFRQRVERSIAAGDERMSAPKSDRT